MEIDHVGSSSGDGAGDVPAAPGHAAAVRPCAAPRMSPAGAAVQAALVTGGSRGLGRALASELLRRGYSVAVVARDATALEVARCTLDASSPGRVAAWTCDVGREGEARNAVARAEERFGRLDLLVNNAGQIDLAPLEATDREAFERSLDVHLYGPVALMRAALPALERSGGRVINVAAIEGLVGLPLLGATAAGKFALVGVTQCARGEWARRGVGVTLVCPGLIRTTGDPAMPGGGARRLRLPGISISVERAARRIVDASEQRRARLVLTPLARGMALWGAVSPGTLASVASRAARRWRSPHTPGNTQPGD
jgi:NAD(P)-dependent dehydrogenase (short-subunit alcohol dehydrogenase family)